MKSKDALGYLLMSGDTLAQALRRGKDRLTILYPEVYEIDYWVEHFDSEGKELSLDRGVLEQLAFVSQLVVARSDFPVTSTEELAGELAWRTSGGIYTEERMRTRSIARWHLLNKPVDTFPLTGRLFRDFKVAVRAMTCP